MTLSGIVGFEPHYYVLSLSRLTLGVAWAGCSTSRWGRGLRPNNNPGGGRPVEMWGAVLYWNRERASQVSRSSLVFCDASLNVCTALSARMGGMVSK